HAHSQSLTRKRLSPVQSEHRLRSALVSQVDHVLIFGVNLIGRDDEGDLLRPRFVPVVTEKILKTLEEKVAKPALPRLDGTQRIALKEIEKEGLGQIFRPLMRV